MVIHPLVVISFNKILRRLKANTVELANLRASQFVLYFLSTSCVLTLAYSTLLLLFCLGTPYCCSVPGDTEEFTRSYQEYEDFQAFESQQTSQWCPVSERVSYLFYASAYLYQTFCHQCNKYHSYLLYYIFLRDMCCDIIFILLYIHVT